MKFRNAAYLNTLAHFYPKKSPLNLVSFRPLNAHAPHTSRQSHNFVGGNKSDQRQIPKVSRSENYKISGSYTVVL